MSKLIALYSPAPGCGKSTVARHLSLSSNYFIARFADPLESMIEAFLIQAGFSHRDVMYYLHDAIGKKTPLWLLPGQPTVRHMKRTLGDEWGRQCNGPQFCALIWKAKVEKSLRGGTSIVCDDLRRPEELDAVLELGGEVWRIERPGYKATPDEDGHASDGALENYHQIWHQYIRNDGTEQMLLDYVDCCLKMEMVA